MEVAEILMSKNIHWFPGHMQKATRKLLETLKMVDIIIELGDARIPESSRARSLQHIISQKPNLFILTKADLADPAVLKEYTNKANTLAGNLNEPKFIKTLIARIEEVGAPIIEKAMKKGLKSRTITVMIVGIPNVGKSTLINKLAKRKAASVENRPGHTRANQYIKISKSIALIDTPGILAPSYEDELVVMRLALVGTIRQEILPLEKMSDFLLTYLKEHYLTQLCSFYDLELSNNLTKEEILLLIAQRRGIIGEEHVILERAAALILNDFKNGALGRISLELS